MKEEKIDYSRRNNFKNVTFKIVSEKGNRPYKFDTENKDRLYSIRLESNKVKFKDGVYSIDFPYKHEDQIELLRLVMENVILDHILKKDLEKFKKIIKEIEEKRFKNEKQSNL